MAEQDSLSWTFYYLDRVANNCYLIGSKLEGGYVTPEDHPLNNRKVFLRIEPISMFRDFQEQHTPFVWDSRFNLYITENMLAVPVAVAGDNFSNLRADLLASNALVLRINLEGLLK